MEALYGQSLKFSYSIKEIEMLLEKEPYYPEEIKIRYGTSCCSSVAHISIYFGKTGRKQGSHEDPLSPAKKMNVNTDDLAPEGLPVFMEQDRRDPSVPAGLVLWEAKKLWACNDRIAEQNYDRLKHMDLCHGLTPAILSYEGIAYQYMAPAVFESGQLQYVQEHLRILSAFYGRGETAGTV